MAKIRRPAVAGSFYPQDKQELIQIIEQLLNNVVLPPRIPYQRIKAAVVPHAGYIYSGLTAVYVFAALQKKKDIKQLILIGPAHFSENFGAALDASLKWETPLGKVPLKRIPLNEQLLLDSNPHETEHCLEVQVPFLQYCLRDFFITPVLTGFDCDYRKLAVSLLPQLRRESLLIASSDLSHYHPQPTARNLDKETIEQILKLDDRELLKDRYQACGKTAILTAVALSQMLGLKPFLLHYDTSATASHDSSQVVGYASIVFTEG